MGYVESAAFLCVTTKTVKDWALDNPPTRNTAPPHQLENLSDTNPPQTSEAWAAVTVAAENNWKPCTRTRGPHT